MDTTVVHFDKFRIVGIAERTTNAAETNSATARIPGLWKRFYQEGVLEKIPNRLDPEVIYEAYFDYESDRDGEYSVMIGAEVPADAEVPPSMTSVWLPRSRYMAFDATGEMPHAVQNAWSRVWNHFDSSNPTPRAYNGDFERFKLDANGQIVDCHLYISLAEQGSATGG